MDTDKHGWKKCKSNLKMQFSKSVSLRVYPWLSSKQSVARVAQTGDDETFFVELMVNGGGENRHARIFFLHGFNSFRRGHQIHHADMFRALLDEQIERGDGTA